MCSTPLSPSVNEEHEARAKALQEALKAGEDSGPAEPFDLATFRKRVAALCDELASIPDADCRSIAEIRKDWSS